MLGRRLNNELCIIGAAFDFRNYLSVTLNLTELCPLLGLKVMGHEGAQGVERPPVAGSICEVHAYQRMNCRLSSVGR